MDVKTRYDVSEEVMFIEQSGSGKNRKFNIKGMFRIKQIRIDLSRKRNTSSKNIIECSIKYGLERNSTSITWVGEDFIIKDVDEIEPLVKSMGLNMDVGISNNAVKEKMPGKKSEEFNFIDTKKLQNQIT